MLGKPGLGHLPQRRPVTLGRIHRRAIVERFDAFAPGERLAVVPSQNEGLAFASLPRTCAGSAGERQKRQEELAGAGQSHSPYEKLAGRAPLTLLAFFACGGGFLVF